ncbi:conserved hypothetical protein [Neospora caninum Liverpool]|uniref:Conserved oligomeric Golgi complex subunit 3 n=1 Tax=Neospora caninum (strain Liverpool) TaxID=572307 RepID=F0VB63_NEOCL|nr:conserved hypothetical protein [Neospora caninum Liverpool]CBZ51400.1 conserved hypothetical protein [Neospora caninum Liverpool]CEL68720.1 TPA: hypothetical protein BN1204_044620 [Neospora caninum Liverpool]|eukprot:XP_003881433.1 conserved hypothetical protein [Neospora caninum Liverpool]
MHLPAAGRPADLSSVSEDRKLTAAVPLPPHAQHQASHSECRPSCGTEAEKRKDRRQAARREDEGPSDPERLLERFSQIWGDSGSLRGYLPSNQRATDRHHGNANLPADKGPGREGDFLRYCRAFYREQERQQQSLLQRPLDELERLRRPLEEVLEGVAQMERDGARLHSAKEEVQRCTSGMHRACRHLVQEQTQLKHIIEVIQSRLAYYTRYEGLRQLLESPRLILTPSTSVSSSGSSSHLSNFPSGGGGTLDVPGLAKALEFIDEAAQFFSVHPDYAEASAYLRKYELLGTRARAVVRSAVLQSLEACQASVERRLQERRSDASRPSGEDQKNQNGEGGDSTASRSALDPALFHVPFRVAGAPLKALTALLVERQRKGDQEAYASAVDQLEAIFVGTRLRLLLPALKEELSRLLLTHATLPDATRHIARYCVSICEMELRTFYVFFPRRRQKEALRTLLEAIGNCAYDCLRPPALACDAVEQLSEIVESLLLDVLQPIDDVDPSKAGDLAPFLSAIYKLVRDIQERLLFRADSFIDDRVRRYPAAAPELVAFIFTSIGFLPPFCSPLSPVSSVSASASSSFSVFSPVQQALHLVTLLRQTVSAEAFGSLCGAALEASCVALSRACLSLESAIHSRLSPQSCLPAKAIEALQNATHSSPSSPPSPSSSSPSSSSPSSSALELGLPFHVFLWRTCEARCRETADAESECGERGARRVENVALRLSEEREEAFADLWAELICAFFLLKHVTVLHSFLESFEDLALSPACRKISFPPLLFGSRRALRASALDAGTAKDGAAPQAKTENAKETGSSRFSLLSWLFLPSAQEEAFDMREQLQRESKSRLDSLLAALVAAFASPLEQILAQIPAELRAETPEGKTLAQMPCMQEEHLKWALAEFRHGLKIQLPAVLLLAMLFFDVLGAEEREEDEGRAEEREEDEEREEEREDKEREEGEGRVDGRLSRKWRRRKQEVLESLGFLIQPLLSGVLSAYEEFSSLLETALSPEARDAIDWKSPEDLQLALLLPACEAAFSTAVKLQVTLSPSE